MTLYEAWKGRRNQIQELLVEDLADYSRERREWERGKVVHNKLLILAYIAICVFTFYCQFLPRHIV